MKNRVQKISPNLWFDHQAEEATQHYISIFKNSQIERITRYGAEKNDIHEFAEGAIMTVEFRLEGQHFVALNGGQHFKLKEAISFIVN